MELEEPAQIMPVKKIISEIEVLRSNKFDDSTINSDKNKSENVLLKIEIEKLHSQINLLKAQPFSIAIIEENDSLISYYTGIPNKTTLYLLFDIFNNMDFKINYFLGWNVERINRNDQILMTLMKLRLNFDFLDLGVRFSCNYKTVINIVLTWLHALHVIISKDFMSSVPSQLKNRDLPCVFNNLINCRIILDSIKIFSAIPCKMNLQKLKYSNYKHCNTLKGLVGVAPNGVLIFCSYLYLSSISDKEMVNYCDLADKGFLINDILHDGLLMNIPPFLTSPQFTPNQVLEILTIAQARVHIERAINRIKDFSILEFIPPELTPYSSTIFQVCGALTNFQ